jgi:hypothetical protein
VWTAVDGPVHHSVNNFCESCGKYHEIFSQILKAQFCVIAVVQVFISGCNVNRETLLIGSHYMERHLVAEKLGLAINLSEFLILLVFFARDSLKVGLISVASN